MTTWRGAIHTGAALMALTVGVQAQTTTKEARPTSTTITKAQIRGEVVHVDGDHLVARMQPGGEPRLFTIQPGQQVIIDGQSKPLSEVKPGTTLTATTATVRQTVSDRTTTVKDGRVVFVQGNKLILALENGDNTEFTVPDDFTVTVDGKEEATVRDLRRGMRVSATRLVSEPRTVIETATVVTGKAPQ